jgi:hypothetical protein
MQTSVLKSVCSATTVAFVALASATRGDAAPNYYYQPPGGWQHTQKLAHGLGVWAQPGSHQRISVVTSVYTGSLQEFTRSQLAVINRLPSAKVGAAQRATVCRAHPAMYITYEARIDGVPTIYEEMLTIWSGVAYIASYARGRSELSTYDARTSLTTLCGGLPPALTSGVSSQPSAHPGASPTPYLGPSQAPETLGTPEPTVTPQDPN